MTYTSVSCAWTGAGVDIVIVILYLFGHPVVNIVMVILYLFGRDCCQLLSWWYCTYSVATVCINLADFLYNPGCLWGPLMCLLWAMAKSVESWSMYSAITVMYCLRVPSPGSLAGPTSNQFVKLLWKNHCDCGRFLMAACAKGQKISQLHAVTWYSRKRALYLPYMEVSSGVCIVCHPHFLFVASGSHSAISAISCNHGLCYGYCAPFNLLLTLQKWFLQQRRRD